MIPSQIPFRITIGVTGHRTLPDQPALRETIQLVLDEIKGAHTYDSQTEFTWCVLTPLAEGADRLVAEEVLKRPEGATLKAVLPLTVADYLEDFGTPQSKEDFHLLLAKDRSPISLKKLPLQDEYPPEMIADAQKDAYEQGGKFVVDHCDILIALWDKKESRGKGSTAEIVRYAEEQGCPRYIISTVDPKKPSPIGDYSTIERHYRDIGKFNNHCASTKSNANDVRAQYDTLFPPNEKPESQQLSIEIREAIRTHLLPYFVVADSLAQKHQSSYFNTGSRVFLLALAAIAVVAGGVIFGSRSSWYIFAIELAILSFIGISIYIADKIQQAHKSWRAYRFLAERLRCAFFLAVGGVEPSPIFLSLRRDDTQKRGHDYHWVIMVFYEIWHRMPVQKVYKGDELELRKNYILGAWIEDQIKYHRDNHDNKTKKSKTWERIGEAVFYCAMVAAAVHVFWPLFIDFHYPHIDDALVFIALLLPAVGTMTESLRTHRQLKYLAIHSRKMHGELTELKNEFRLLTPRKFESLLLETDRLMLRENMDWLALSESSHLSKAV